MEFIIWCKHEGDSDESAWSEQYNKPGVTDAQEWAESIISSFNSGRYPDEKPRVLVRIEVLPESDKQPHDWKKASLVTVIRGIALYDVYRCSRCGAKGKRHGLQEYVKPDRRVPKWCNPKPSRT
jgi:hypothetical protein